MCSFIAGYPECIRPLEKTCINQPLLFHPLQRRRECTLLDAVGGTDTFKGFSTHNS